MELLLFALAFWVLMIALATVGWVSWRRTAPLRSGRSQGSIGSLPTLIRSSRTTFLAAAAGASLAMTGGVAIARSPTRPIALLVSALGAWIVAAGLWSRVTGFEALGAGLVLRYGQRPPFHLTWAECRSLRPPRWPMGGWRLATERGNQTLMPSDVLGNEWMLDHLVRSAGLSFDGRRWIRMSPSR